MTEAIQLDICTNGYPDGRKYVSALEVEIEVFLSVQSKTRNPQVYMKAKQFVEQLRKELENVGD